MIATADEANHFAAHARSYGLTPGWWSKCRPRRCWPTGSWNMSSSCPLEPTTSPPARW